MIMRLDRLQAEIPPPSDPDPDGASLVQELLGGKFGEMSTFMNYTYQSFNFRNRQGARPFYDLVASIAAEEFGHIELVSTAINTMLTGAAKAKPKKGALKGVKDARNSQQFLAGGASAMVQDSMGKPWSGDYVNATGDLIGDLTHNFFLETGARNNKLKVYEAVDHPAARALTGYLLVRGGVHQVAYARALENLTGANMDEPLPLAADPDRQNPGVQTAHQTRRTPEALPLVAGRLQRALRRLQRPAPGNGRGARSRRGAPPRGRPRLRPAGAAGRLRPRSRSRRNRRNRAEAARGRRAPAASRAARSRTRANGASPMDLKRPELLAIYLNDHLAGATGGVELARRARGANEGTEFGPPLATLCAEIEADREKLQSLMDELGVGRSRLKPPLGWLAEKLGRLKLNGQVRGYSPLGRVLDLEGMVLGTNGRLRLWSILDELVEDEVSFDLKGLIAKAEDHRSRLEDLQLRAARLL